MVLGPRATPHFACCGINPGGRQRGERAVWGALVGYAGWVGSLIGIRGGAGAQGGGVRGCICRHGPAGSLKSHVFQKSEINASETLVEMLRLGQSEFNTITKENSRPTSFLLQ